MTTIDDETDHITPVFTSLIEARTPGELGEAIYAQVARFSFLDLHILGSAMQFEINMLPSPYREMVEPYLEEELLGRYYRILAMHSDGSFGKMADSIRNREAFEDFCKAAISFGAEVFEGDDDSLQYAQLGGLSYFLLHCFALFVLEEPGHPVGMPFPNGSRVEIREGVFYCPGRCREKDMPLSLCSYCPAKQDHQRRESSAAHSYSE